MRQVVAAASSLIMLVALSCSPTRLPKEYREIEIPANVLSSSEAQERGRDSFLRHCSICHGERADGRGTRTGLSSQPANLSDPLWRDQSTPRWVFYVIREGIRHTSMGGMKNVLSVDATWNIVAYILSEKEDIAE